MSYLLPFEVTKDWGVIERLKVASDMLKVRDGATRRSGQLTDRLNAALDEVAVAINLASSQELPDERDARMERELEAYCEAHGGDHPSFSEMFPFGERVVIEHMFNGREFARGWICGHTTGMVDYGSSESGPGPVEMSDLVMVRRDDGQIHSYCPSQLEPEDGYEYNVAFRGSL